MRHLLLLFLLGLSFGQEVLLLDPRKVYELALKNNKELQKLEHQIKALEIDYQLAQKYYLPVVYAGASLLYDMDKKNIRTEGSLTVISTLYELQKTRSRIELSKIRRDIAHVMLQQLHRDLQLKILKLFSDAQIYRKLAEVKREEMAIAYVRFDRARERKELGLATEHEVLKLESLYREKRSELLQAQHLYNHTLLEVKNLAGISLETIIQLKELDFREPERQVLDFSQLREEILRENSGLKIKDMEIRMYEEDIKLARQVVMPRVNLRISTNKSGLELSTPIYDAGRGYKIDYLLSFKRSAQSERENLEQSLRLISLSAPYEWEFLRAKLVEAYAKDRFAEENLTLRRSEYELELAFDLGYAMAEKSEAERQLMEARYKLLLFWARLFSIAGREPFSLLE
ncbi:MAG: TolC family protein [Aquificaceae bacterium]|nr:TolC family protein [Aquificaceae bacterium]MCS7196446.1 TolC family protein [Aquificaceae bacterium]MDW8032840.1 TolC family protein [Aquificaceae bacterium]MDW8294963.1 TolC family protein [Aquificaceae bacterium]